MATTRYLKDRKKWLVRWHKTIKDGIHVGRTIKGSKTFASKSHALQFQLEIEKRLETISQTRGCCTTVHDAVTAFLRRCEKIYTTQTCYLYTLVLHAFDAHAGDVFCNDLTPQHIRSYLDNLLANGRTARTANAHLTPIKSLCKYMSLEYDIANPAAKVPMLREAPPKRRFLDESEYEKALAAGDRDFRTWAEFIANTGLRVSEFCSLRFADLADDRSYVTVLGKGRKTRTIPLNSICRSLLLMQPQQSQNSPIFLSKSRKPVNRYLVRDKCLHAAKAAGIRSFGPHALRHLFATRMILAGVNLSMVAKILGHSSVTTTERIYVHILPRHLLGLTDAICP